MLFIMVSHSSPSLRRFSLSNGSFDDFQALQAVSLLILTSLKAFLWLLSKSELNWIDSAQHFYPNTVFNEWRKRHLSDGSFS